MKNKIALECEKLLDENGFIDAATSDQIDHLNEGILLLHIITDTLHQTEKILYK